MPSPSNSVVKTSNKKLDLKDFSAAYSSLSLSLSQRPSTFFRSSMINTPHRQRSEPVCSRFCQGNQLKSDRMHLTALPPPAKRSRDTKRHNSLSTADTHTIPIEEILNLLPSDILLGLQSHFTEQFFFSWDLRLWLHICDVAVTTPIFAGCQCRVHYW